MLRDIRNLFENKEEENYHRPAKVSNFWSNDYIEDETKLTEIKHYELRNILIKLEHI